MNDRYRLGGLEDDQLLATLSALVKRENDSLSDLLAHLAELDSRALCIAIGYSSLFAYCTEALGFCKSAAGRRVAAARVCLEYPEVFSRVATGELQLSVLCALRPHLNAGNASALFAACIRKSYEQVEAFLAARFPKPDVRDLIRRLPTAAVGTPDIGTQRVQDGPEPTEVWRGVRSYCGGADENARCVRSTSHDSDGPPGRLLASEAGPAWRRAREWLRADSKT